MEFYNVDIFKHRDLLSDLGVTGTPTFKLWVNGELVDSVVSTEIGDVEAAVTAAIEQYDPSLFDEVIVNDEVVTDEVSASQTDSNSLADKLSALF